MGPEILKNKSPPTPQSPLIMDESYNALTDDIPSNEYVKDDSLSGNENLKQNYDEKLENIEQRDVDKTNNGETDDSVEQFPKFRKDNVESHSSTATKKPTKIRASVKETGYDSMSTYLKSMGNHELLRKNEEIILARKIQILMKWEELRNKK